MIWQKQAASKSSCCLLAPFVKALTEEWLTKNAIYYDQLILSSYPELSDPEYKIKMYRELSEPFYDVIFAIDDRDTVVRMWRDNGVTCLDIANNHFS